MLHPLVTLDKQGEVVEVRCSEAPDREPFTEFYAGVLVLGLEEEQIPELPKSREPLTKWLPALLTDRQTLYLLTGLDYPTLTPTPNTRIQPLR